jgi:hypothetical protein
MPSMPDSALPGVRKLIPGREWLFSLPGFFMSQLLSGIQFGQLVKVMYLVDEKVALGL